MAINREEINGFKINTFNQHNLKVGARESTCPLCSHNRSPRNQKAKCASLDWMTGLGTCHHCDETFQLHTFSRNTETTTIVKPKLSDEVIEYFANRGISKETLTKAGVEGDGTQIIFKTYKGGRVVKTKYRYTNSKRFHADAGGETIPYNVNAIQGNDTIIICEGEIDCLSMIEAGFNNVISAPNGANGSSWINNCYSLFKSVKHIIVLADNDDAGEKMRETMDKEFVDKEISHVRLEIYNDPNELLMAEGVDALANLVGGNSGKLTRLLDRKININSNMIKEDVLLWYKDKPFLSRGDISFITGQAGTGKSFLTTFIVSQIIKPDNVNFHSDLKDHEYIAWFDTEQKRNHVIKIVRRIEHLADSSRVEMYMQREVTKTADRFDEFKAYMDVYSPALVVIDGLTDYVEDSNGLAESNKTISEVLEISSRKQCCVLAIVHQNESGGVHGSSKKMRGHVGSEGTRKAENVIGVELGNQQFNVKRFKTRNEPWKEWSFKIENNGELALPIYISDKDRRLTAEEAGRHLIDELLEDPIEAAKVFTEIFNKLDNEGIKNNKDNVVDAIMDWSKGQTVKETRAVIVRDAARDLLKDLIERNVIHYEKRKPLTVVDQDQSVFEFKDPEPEPFDPSEIPLPF